MANRRRHIGNVKAETLVDTLAATLSETDVKTIGETQGDVETRILVKTLAFKQEGVAEKFDHAASLCSRG